MEDLLWKYPDDFFPRQGFKQAARQQGLSEAGRLDISFRDDRGRLWIVEVKATAISVQVADQVTRYVDELQRRHVGESIVPAVVAPKISATVGMMFDRVGIAHYEITEAEFRRVALDRGEQLEPPEVPDIELRSSVPGRPTVFTRFAGGKGAAWYANLCHQGLCHRCRYKTCGCPHHSGGNADPEIVSTYRNKVATGWMSVDCQSSIDWQSDAHKSCRKSDCGCRCHVKEAASPPLP